MSSLGTSGLGSRDHLLNGHRLDAEVLVVGAGPVGLSLAIELGQRGIATIVVEQYERVGRQPRAKTTNVRSMEHMRRWGIAEHIRAAAPLPADYPTDVVFATRLFGRPLARFENAFSGYRERNELYSEPAQWIPQYKVEAVLRDLALTLPSVSLCLGTRLEDFASSADGVIAELRAVGSGQARRVRARYLVGADGARSRVRERLGIAMTGEHAYASNIGIVYRAPGLGRLHPLPPAIMYWLVNPEAPGLTGPMDQGDTWHAIMPMPSGGGDLDTAAACRLIRAAAGRDLDLEILTLDPWSAHSLIAEHYQSGAVFLAGDACHLHPPFGGYGMNLGIGDAVDLGWKLAAALRGWGGPRLLASYAEERRPIHERVIAEAVANSGLLSHHLIRPGLEADDAEGAALRTALGREILEQKRREFKTLGVVLGLSYAGSSVILDDGSTPPPWHFAEYRPSAHPGCLAPHLWLGDTVSLYDCFGPGFTLLVTAAGAEVAVEEFRRAAADRAMPLEIVAPADSRLLGLYGRWLALIRPDQHVAWRGDRLDRPAGAILDLARGA